MDSDMAFYAATDLLKQMISIPSVSRSVKDVADIIENYLKQFNDDVIRKGNNILIKSQDFDSSRPTILLNSHIDTVKPVDSWTRDPYNPEEEDNYIYGLGSNDAGASVVSMLHSFLILTAKPQPYNLIFLASCEEEVSGKNGIESVIPDLVAIALALVGETKGMTSPTQAKGFLGIEH